MPLSSKLRAFVAFVSTAVIFSVFSEGAMSQSVQGVSPPLISIQRCNSVCSAADLGLLSITDPASGHVLELPISSPVIRVENVQNNSAGNMVIVGQTEGGLDTIFVVDMRSKKLTAEFSTTTASVSPNGRFVAFEKAVSTHGPDSLYSDTMVYVYDTFILQKHPSDLYDLPAGAFPVFPRALVSSGQHLVMSASPFELLHVISTDFRWTSDSTFEFMAGKSAATRAQQSNTVYPIHISIATGSSDAEYAGSPGLLTSSVGQGIACDRLKIIRWTVQGISEACLN